ncbi:protein-export chaperone SecB [Chrysiogenes arsenatis]|uniref:protein-export chaperone SecB n=1 Tax=Chrysiogenes arsenatis TaxID=309797 RepID=UPI0003F77694|nr:protein-export chaperone SecB [Chrysiogenes arsenatis]
MSSLGGIHLLGTLLEGVNYRTRPRYQLKDVTGQQEMQMNFNTSHLKLDDENRYKVSLVTSLVFTEEKTAPFVLEVVISGIFALQGEYDADDMAVVLNVNCPSLLLPYSREMVSNLTLRSEYGVITLPSVNFMQLYQARKKAEAAKENAESVSPAQ